MQPALLQIFLALAMFLTTAIAGFLPLKLLKYIRKKNSNQASAWLSLLSCFSGGVFMATCFLDIIPHVNENYERFLEDSGSSAEFPYPQLGICVGFFVVYLIEEVCAKVFSMGHGHSHGSVEAPRPLPPAPTPIAPLPVRRKESINLRNTELGKEALMDNEPPYKQPLERTLSLHSLVMEQAAQYSVADKPESNFLKSLTFAVAMSFHSILEGFALGVQDSTGRIVTLFLSLILHKGIEAFSVGLQISKENSDKMKSVALTILVYAFMTPLGSALGTLLQMSNINEVHKDVAVLVLESLAAGTFIYVTFLEVLAHEKDNEQQDSLKQLLAIFVGFMVITILQFVFGGHGHEEHHHGAAAAASQAMAEAASTLASTLTGSTAPAA